MIPTRTAALAQKRQRLSEEIMLKQRTTARHSRLCLRPDAARRDFRVARRLAAFRRLAPVNVAREAVDQPYIVVGGTFHADEPRAHRRNQRGKQNRGGDDGRADQYGYRGSQVPRRDRTARLMLALSFLCWKQGQITSLTLLCHAIELFRNASGRFFVRTSALARRHAAAGILMGHSVGCSRDRSNPAISACHKPNDPVRLM
jgi:hypothetical protein